MLSHDCMLIRRCAWHRLYNGYPILYGVASWRQRGVQYTDGMCRRCAAVALQAWSRTSEPAPPRRRAGRVQTPVGSVGIAVAAVILVLLGISALARRDGGRDRGVSALPRAEGAPAVSAGRTS